jgi:general secretion pathway protein D
MAKQISWLVKIMKRMKNGKWFIIHFVCVIVFFSCAGRPPAMNSGAGMQESARSPASSTREKAKAQSAKGYPGGPGAADPSVPTVMSSNRPATSQPSASDSQDVQRGSKKEPNSPANPGAAHRDTYTDYRSKVLFAKQKKPESSESKLAQVGEDIVTLNFDNADLGEAVATIAELIGLKYIVEPGIQGTVTIHTAGGIAKENLLSVLYLILEVNGLTAVKDEEFYRITTVEGASRLPTLLRFQTEGKPHVRREEIITQIIPLQYISAAEMSKLIKPFLSTNGTVISHEGSNTLVVVAKGIKILKALKLVEAFDIGLFEKTNHRFFFLKNADSEDVVKILKEVFAPTIEGRKDGVKFIPIKRLNAFLAISPETRMFNKTEQLLLNLDATTEGIEPRIYVYFVKNGTALNLDNLLKQVFAKAISTGEPEKPQPLSPSPIKPALGVTNPLVKSGETGFRTVRTTSPQQEAAPPEEVKEVTTESSYLKGTIKITPDEIRNALIIEATPANYRVIMNLLKKIDVLPRQVLIEATIAEIDYSLFTELGVTWEYVKGQSVGSGLLNLTSSGDAGLAVAIGIGDDLKATLNALERQNRVNILSSPHVLASDNQEARIDVSSEIPIVSAETVVPTGGQSIVTTTVQYRDTGVLLTVTPHINERGLVSMDIYQEVSEQSEDVVVAGEAFPSFFKRAVKTSLTVQNGQTIVLGGLIRQNKSKSSSGIPGLARIPLIGSIFGATRDAFDKTELIILLTPRVIVNLDDVDDVTDGFKSKVDSVVKDMYTKRSISHSPLTGEDKVGVTEN